jgi:transposase
MLKHEYPPGCRARPRHYPKLGPFIPTIDKLLHDDDTPMPARPRSTARHIFERLCCEEGFTGSYDSVRKYIRGACRDESAWERAYELVLRLPKHRAIDLMRSLSGGNTSVLTSTHFRALTRELPSKWQRVKREEQRRAADIEWMRRVLQKQINDDVLVRDFNDIQDLLIMLRYLRTGPLLHRNRAMVVLACQRKISGETIGAFLGVSKGFVRKYRNKFASGGADNVFAPQTKSNRKVDSADLQRAVFSLLHEPPTTYGMNRTTWTMPILRQVLRKNGRQVGHKVVGKIIKAAGYKWRKAKVVLTSNDPAYNEKLDRIRSILANLHP